jgi:hypothetical protein
MELLSVGDLHTTDHTGSGGLAKYIENPDRFVMGEVQKVLDYGKRKGVLQVVFKGDICDGPRMSYEASLAFMDLIDANPDFEFYIYLGNHDMYGETPELGHSLQLLQRVYAKSKRVRIFTRPKTVMIDEVPVRFLPYPHMDFDKRALNFFHKEVYGSKSDSGRINNDKVLSKSRAVAVGGHLHTAHRIRNTDFVGTLYQTNFGEALPKYFAHIEFDSPHEYEIKLVKNNPLYKLHTVVLQDRGDLKYIPTAKTDLVKLVIQDGCDVGTQDYAHLKNIAVLKNFKSKDDLAAVLTEDIKEGTELIIRTDDFFKSWIESLDEPTEMRQRIKGVRRRILNSFDNPKNKYHRSPA